MVDRIDRINSQVHIIASNFFNEHRERFFPYFLTITNMIVSRDLQHAKIWFSVLGNNINEKSLLEKLEHSRRDLQTNIARKVSFKFTPIIEFRIDHSSEQAQKIESVLKKIKRK